MVPGVPAAEEPVPVVGVSEGEMVPVQAPATPSPTASKNVRTGSVARTRGRTREDLGMAPLSTTTGAG